MYIFDNDKKICKIHTIYYKKGGCFMIHVIVIFTNTNQLCQLLVGGCREIETEQGIYRRRRNDVHLPLVDQAA